MAIVTVIMTLTRTSGADLILRELHGASGKEEKPFPTYPRARSFSNWRWGELLIEELEEG